MIKYVLLENEKTLETYEKVVNNTLNKQNISKGDKEICEIFLKQYEEYKIRKKYS